MPSLTVNGQRFHLECWNSGPPLLLLHGFTGSLETWRPFCLAWPDHTLIALDLIGHGQSDAPADPARYRMAQTVADLLALLDALALARVAVLGYSLGGRIALRLALTAPERVRCLILEGASPGLPTAAERAARRQSDAALAELIEREGVAAFVAHWEQLPLWASQQALPPAVRAQLRAQRLANRPEGLANSLRGLGAGEDEPVLDQLPTLGLPVLLIVGALDQRYRELAAAMANRLPQAEVAVIPGAGHAVHLEQPAAFAATVQRFLARTAPSDTD
jgi:2-succinyl-6-hydroxy-2,4-cyclohexadiene-1-carboxylate synthase